MRALRRLTASIGGSTRIFRARLRTDRLRIAMLAAGIFVAALTFGLLSAETTRSHLAVTGTVRHNFRAAYQILVRPRGAQTSVERRHHLVDAGFLSGLFGGITLSQYEAIRSLPGVSVAAPVANVGYFTLQDEIFVPFPKSVSQPGQAAYRITVSWNVHDGLADYPGASFYLYWTRRPLTFSTTDPQQGTETVDGRSLDVCEGFYDGQPEAGVALYRTVDGKRVLQQGQRTVADPYSDALRPTFGCSSKHVNVVSAAARGIEADLPGPKGAAIHEFLTHGTLDGEPSGQRGALVDVQIPVLVAGVDPAAEQRLVGLKSALTSGRYLTEGEGPSQPHTFGHDPVAERAIPVIASEDTFLDQSAKLTIQQLRIAHISAAVMASKRAYRLLTAAAGTAVARTSLGPTTAWRQELRDFPLRRFTGLSDGYWRVSSSTYRMTRHGVLIPATVTNDPRVFINSNQGGGGSNGLSLAPPGSDDTWYRRLQLFGGATGAVRTIDGNQTYLAPVPELVGTFSPAKLAGFSPLSRVPLQTFYPPTVTAADAATHRALGRTALGPTTNLAGYLSQPPLMLTTIQGAVSLENGEGGSYTSTYQEHLNGKTVTKHIHVSAYSGASPHAPISAIQVRVKGVSGPTRLSFARINLVADEIASETGLVVDVTAGSSPTQQTIQLSPGEYGEPALLVSQAWAKKGADLSIFHTLDSQDLDLAILILLACGLFTANSAAASVRQRRSEIAVLSTFGWRRRDIFTLIVGENVVIALAAGVVALVVVLALNAIDSLAVPTSRIWVIVPLALLVALIATLVPAWRTARLPPLEGLSNPARAGTGHTRANALLRLAVVNLIRTRARSIITVISLALAVAVLTIVVGLSFAFGGAVATTALGRVVTTQVHGVAIVSAILVIVLGIVSLTDVLIISMQERRNELGVLSATGWRQRDLRRLVLTEAAILGALGAGLGTVAGITAVVLLGGSWTSILATAVVAMLVGAGTPLALLSLPVSRFARINPAQLLLAE